MGAREVLGWNECVGVTASLFLGDDPVGPPHACELVLSDCLSGPICRLLGQQPVSVDCS